jgi:hypothetical protein
VEDVLQEEARADQDDAEFQPEFVSGYAGAEDSRYTEDVADGESEDDGPEDILKMWERDAGVGCTELGKGVFEKLAQEADAEEKANARKRAHETGRGRWCRDCDRGRDGVGSGHFSVC